MVYLVCFVDCFVISCFVILGITASQLNISIRENHITIGMKGANQPYIDVREKREQKVKKKQQNLSNKKTLTKTENYTHELQIANEDALIAYTSKLFEF